MYFLFVTLVSRFDPTECGRKRCVVSLGPLPGDEKAHSTESPLRLLFGEIQLRNARTR